MRIFRGEAKRMIGLRTPLIPLARTSRSAAADADAPLWWGVKRWQDQLATALLELSTSPAVTNAAIIVQDFARNDFELRHFVIDGATKIGYLP